MIDLPTLDERLAVRNRPKRMNVMYQRWENLLFLHWECAAKAIQKTLPKGLYVDTFEERAFIGIVPFYMKNIRPRFCPAVPGISNFLEVNLRTYVHDGKGTSGVWFYSLDANQWLAVKLARTWFCLPYFHAKMSAQNIKGEIHYNWQRKKHEENGTFIYKTCGEPYEAKPGTLEFFLAERYILFSLYKNQIYTGHVHHTPYPLCKTEVASWDKNLLALSGFNLDGAPMHMLMSEGVDVEVFALKSSKDSSLTHPKKMLGTWKK